MKACQQIRKIPPILAQAFEEIKNEYENKKHILDQEQRDIIEEFSHALDNVRIKKIKAVLGKKI